MRPLAKHILRGGQILLVALGLLGLAASALWLWLERGWTATQNLEPADAFRRGTLGLELAPLKYLLVIDTVSANAMTKKDGRGWQTAFGFLPNPSGKTDRACVANAAERLPVGFTISHLLPGSAGGSPVPFVGLACATCHSAQIRGPGGSLSPVLYGVGNVKLDLMGWTDAMRNAVLDPHLSADVILDAYDSLGCGDGGMWSHWPFRSLERFIISNWLAGARAQMGSDNSKYDLPFWGRELDDFHEMPTGPLRTRPFRSIVRNALDLPGADNWAISKIPAVFEQNEAMKPKSQFDGSIADHVVRSMVAAFASGSTLEALSKPVVFENVALAADYTLRLGDDYAEYAYATRFPDPANRIDPQRAARGFEVYRRHCLDCHGSRPLGGGAWSLEGAGRVKQINTIGPANGPGIGTDPARVEFRYARMLPDGIYLRFPGSPVGEIGKLPSLSGQRARVTALIEAAKLEGRGGDASLWLRLSNELDEARRLYPAGHPLGFKPEVLTYNEGYLNSPIPFAYLRAPFLHNGSVPTLAGLINLTRRPAAFCRGDNAYDPVDVGIAAPEATDPAQCASATPFFFDTRPLGNRNTGHDFPWAWDDPARDEARLRDLLEYLKTL